MYIQQLWYTVSMLNTLMYICNPNGAQIKYSIIISITRIFMLLNVKLQNTTYNYAKEIYIIILCTKCTSHCSCTYALLCSHTKFNASVKKFVICYNRVVLFSFPQLLWT